MADASNRLKEIFLAVFELPSPQEREAYLSAACGSDEELRRQVEALLQAQAVPDSFLEKPAAEMGHTVDAAPADRGLKESSNEQVGRRIGPYKLLELIGEGGMGTVWMAEQTEPVRRMVAIKLIKPGMDSRAVLARFEAERQALALMDHPNIAKVLEAGATSDGRPFFVMELVKGTPITAYCDANKLSPRQRLELFVPVCQAIQHAHQKGVIHRDIKPSNVLIALYDDKPVPKVIDFGIAKAAGQPLTERTLHTGFGAIVGTPEYMSPEQATFNQLDIDTRSDVYSLGVLLYELLTGTTPVDKTQLKEAAILEVLRVVREDEPPRPSVKLSTTAARASIAATRNTEPSKLSQLLRGELDWIVMKSLEKDRNRRYETAAGLARDVDRYLKDELVEARPPSVGYRLRKSIRKNRGPVIAVSLVFLALLAGVVGTTWGMMRALEAEREMLAWYDQAVNKTEEAVIQEGKARLAEEAARQSAQDEKAAREQAEENSSKAYQAAADTKLVLSFLTMTVINPSLDSLLKDGKFSTISLKDALLKAEKRVSATFAHKPLLEASVRQMLGSGLLTLGDVRTGAAQLEQSFAIRKDKLGPDHRDTVEVMLFLADACQANGKPARAIELLEEAMRIKKAKAAAKNDDLLVLSTRVDRLADYYEDAKRYDDSIRLRREIVDRYRQEKDFKTLASTLHELGRTLMDAGRPEEAEPVLRESLTLHEKGESHVGDWYRFAVAGNLGNCLLVQKKYTEAEPLLKSSFDELKKREGTSYAKGPIVDDGYVQEAGKRLIKLFEATDRADEAMQVRQLIKAAPKKSKK
jgi:serine/threonine protein kinase/tetratricopeptide (TPR) repeat protein